MPRRKQHDFRRAVLAAMGIESVNSLAARAGVPQPTLAQWLAGKHATINSGALEKVAAALGLELRKEKLR